MLLFHDVLKPELDAVVTGIGLVTPLAVERQETWNRLKAGHRAARSLDSRDIDHFDALSRMGRLKRFGAPADHAEVRQRLKHGPVLSGFADALLLRAWLDEPVVAMTLLALTEAAQDARLSLPVDGTWRSGCFIGASKGGLRTAEKLVAAHGSGVASVVDDGGSLWQHAFQVNAATTAAASVAGVRTAVSCPVAACATGLISILQGAAAIHSGLCDICFCGSADAALRASVLSSFHRLNVTSGHPEASTACRPFDVARDGFVVGEGAGVLVLESRQHAAARGVPIYARVTGGGWLSDPTGITQIDTSGSIVAELLKRTICSLSGCDPRVPAADFADLVSSAAIDYVNLHGTGTISNDQAEASGMQRCFEGQLPKCSAFKGSIGHLLGAAGSVESALTMMALRQGYLPGTRNLNEMDEQTCLPLIFGRGMAFDVRRAAKLSLGFGGHVACGIFDAED